MYLRLSARNFHPQHVRDFGDWNTGTYLHFQPNIIVIRTYTPKPQIQIEHYQTSQKQLYVHKWHTDPSYFNSQHCVQAYKLYVILKLHIKTQPLVPVYYTPILRTSSGPIFKWSLPNKTKYILNTWHNCFVSVKVKLFPCMPWWHMGE